MDYSKDITNRLKRVEGQIRGVIRMMEDQKACADVVTQLSAVKGAIDRTIGIIVSNNLEQCVRENMKDGLESSEVVNEAIQLLVKNR